MPDRQDRRVLRSRAALMAAAVRLVAERGTTAVSVTDLADAADVSRQLVYLQFGDRDALLVAAAADLVERELFADVGDAGAPRRSRVLAITRHFARHRPFYRAMLTGSCALPMTRTLNTLFGSLITLAEIQKAFGGLDEPTAHDLIALITGGSGSIVNSWLIDRDDATDPEELADRLLRLSTVLFTRADTDRAPAPEERPL